MKLTKPQIALLADLAITSAGVSPTYRPAKKLVELGLCIWVPGKYSDYLRITDAGRAAISEAEEGQR